MVVGSQVCETLAIGNPMCHPALIFFIITQLKMVVGHYYYGGKGGCLVIFGEGGTLLSGNMSRGHESMVNIPG